MTGFASIWTLEGQLIISAAERWIFGLSNKDSIRRHTRKPEMGLVFCNPSIDFHISCKNCSLKASVDLIAKVHNNFFFAGPKHRKFCSSTERLSTQTAFKLTFEFSGSYTDLILPINGTKTTGRQLSVFLSKSVKALKVDLDNRLKSVT